jgi:hypothetical protein
VLFPPVVPAPIDKKSGIPVHRTPTPSRSLTGALLTAVFAASLIAAPAITQADQASAAGSSSGSSSTSHSSTAHSSSAKPSQFTKAGWQARRAARLEARGQRSLANREEVVTEASNGPDKDITMKAWDSHGPIRVYIMRRSESVIVHVQRRGAWLTLGPLVPRLPVYQGGPEGLKQALDRFERVTNIKTGPNVIPSGWNERYPKAATTSEQSPSITQSFGHDR